MDEVIRKLNREAVSGDAHSIAALIRSKQRSGFITGEAVKLAAELGCEASQLIIPSSLVDWAKWDERRSLLERVLTLMGRPFVVRFSADCAEQVLPVFEAEYPNDDRPRMSIAAARDWAVSPTEELRMAAAAAAGSAAGSASSAYAAAYAAAWADAWADAAAGVAYAAAVAAASSAARSAAYAARSAARSAASSAGVAYWTAAAAASAASAAGVGTAGYASSSVASSVASSASAASAASDASDARAARAAEYEWQRARLASVLLGE